MARISQGVVNIANERHVSLRIETNTATEGNYRAYIMIVPKFPRANASGAFVSSAQNHIVKGGPVIKSDGAAAISTALTNLGLGEGSALPVGVPVPWPAATAPTGWLKCNGAAFTAAQYPKLAQAYPALVLPDLRAEFIRGWDDGRGIDSSRVLLSSQKGSVIPGDDGLSTPNVVGINNLLNNTALWGMDQATVAEITGCYIAVIASTNSSNSIQTNIAGISRPRNVAFNYIVRAA